MAKEKNTHEEILEEFGSEETFSLIDFVKNKVKYPTREVSVCLDYEAALTAQDLINRAADIENLIQAENDRAGGITGGDVEDLEAELTEVKEKLAPVMESYNDSLVTFTLRGVAPKLWRVLDDKHRQEFASKTKDIPKGDPAITEANIAMNRAMNLELLAASIVAIETPDGKKADYSGKRVPVTDLKYFFENVTEIEWSKLVNMGENLTFANFAFEQEAAEPNF